ARPGRDRTERVDWCGFCRATEPGGGWSVQPRPARRRPSSQPPQGSRAVYASWTTSFLLYPHLACHVAGWQVASGPEQAEGPPDGRAFASTALFAAEPSAACRRRQLLPLVVLGPRASPLQEPHGGRHHASDEREQEELLHLAA